MPDTPAIAKRRIREKKTISQIVALYCAEKHPADQRTERAHCGELVCPTCAQIDAYASLRTDRCRRMDVKISCEKCGNHCYAPEKREHIRTIMRYAAPRMLLKHPIAALRHMVGR